MTAVIVGGAIANKPWSGGSAWTRASWALGLARLGFDITFVEQISASACLDMAGNVVPLTESNAVTYFNRVCDQVGLAGRAALVTDDGRRCWGLQMPALRERARKSALLVNISGNITLPELFEPISTRAYVDLDPGYTQYWLDQSTGLPNVRNHTHFFTVGSNIGKPTCSIPTCGIPWRPVRQPVVLDDWPVHGGGQRFTTIASWRGPFGPVNVDGRNLGAKLYEFRRFAQLPLMVAQPFEIALDIHPAEREDNEMLQRCQWNVVDPRAVAGDPHLFRKYVGGSLAEFSVAQSMYVETQGGWFSDRTTRYLASGKPALVQDTGFADSLPVGEGLLTFRTLAEAVAGAESIVAHIGRHRRAARAIAETYFDSNKVLQGFVDECEVTP